ncbi:MAG: type II toxin-antitoxin system RelE/ParE family toxin [bacterium]|nr:type II toxin-antitoxin system RelE/ParE family toxin [bacterium]
MIVAITAEADLEQIATYVAELSPRSAFELNRALRNTCESLLDAPRGYPLVPRHEQFGVRRRPCGKVTGFIGTGQGTHKFATGSAASLAGKSFGYTARPTGPGQYVIEFKVE